MSQSITCPVCGKTSHNTNDVQHRYCGFCHKFHDQFTDAERTAAPIIMATVRSRWAVERTSVYTKPNGRGSVSESWQKCVDVPELTSCKRMGFGGDNEKQHTWYVAGDKYDRLHDACIAVLKARTGAAA
jgi:hypothetical protein